MSHCLILNADYQPLSLLPLSTVSWQDAMKLQFLDRVKVLETYEDWVVHSPSQNVNVPAVLVLSGYVHFNRSVKFSRSNLILRDNNTCQYCGDKFSDDALTMDHVIPRHRGGKTNWNNIVMACKYCNSTKGTKMWKPLSKPFKPSVNLLESRRKNHSVVLYHPTWKNYLPWDEKHHINKFIRKEF